MKVEYRRDLQNSYLVLIAENQDTDESYDLRMIMENQIEGLLSCERKLLNNDILYYYDVTSQVSLEDKCKVQKIQGQEILLLLNRLLSVLDKLEEYLLNEQSLCLLPQYIYMNENEEEIQFCYVPGEHWDFQKQLRELMEYLLPFLEHNNQESMMIGYGLYHYILREKFTVDGLHKQLNLYYEIHKNGLSVVGSKEEIVETNVINQKEDELWENAEEDNDQVQNDNCNLQGNQPRGLCTLVGIVWILSGWFLWRNFADLLWIWGLVGGVVIVLLVLLSIKWRTKNEEVSVAKLKAQCEIEPGEEYTQLLNISPGHKTYVLKNENEIITLNNKSTYIIGRDEYAADIVLRSTVVSRKHGQIRIEKNKCFLSDLYSRNGIRVNGTELAKGKEIELFGGELIQFADISFYFLQEN